MEKERNAKAGWEGRRSWRAAPRPQSRSRWAQPAALCGILWLAGCALAAANTNSVTTNAIGALVLTNYFGDLNDDQAVDVRDLVLLIHQLNQTRLLPAPMLARADLNQDSHVNDADRLVLAGMIARRWVKADEDFDGDELANAEELAHGTNPFDPDTDHDGALDGWEVVDGTDPFNPQSRVPMTIVARPPVQVIYPLIQDSDTNAVGQVLARPPMQVIHPLVLDSDTNRLGAVLARPPVTVTNPPPQ